ncbi:MAG: OmcA/MtrC family decaheme c-type cytochrome [Gallionella sp.]
MKATLIRLGLMAVMISALASCGGTSNGAPGAPGAPGTNGTSGNAVTASSLTADQWLAIKPSIDPASISVTINSPPVVKFKVTDQYGNPLVGLGGQVQGTNSALPKNYNIVFTLAKLVPVVGGPSVWRSYLVTKPSVSGGVVSWAGTYPTFEQEGTLVDNGDGSYQYTFYRDIKQAATIVAGLTDSGNNHKADLGDLSYDPTLTHRLGIVIQGSQPGTGTNTPNGVQVTTPVPLVNTFNIGYDFRPDGGTITTTRDIVEKASCTECHQGRGIGHFSPNYTTSTDPAKGTPAGTFIGRNDPRLCVTCHTDQAKYSFAETPKIVSATGVANYDDTSSVGYKRVYGEAAFTYPRMIHQTHMGNQLVKTGYNLNAHAKKSDGTTGCDSTSSNAGQCFNQVEYPQDVRNCTKCHDGSTNAVNKTKDGDNWMNVPSRLACGACHDGIDFTLAAGAVGSVTLQDRDADVKAKVAVGTTHTGHLGGIQTDDHLCTTCHSAGNVAIYHGPAPTNPATGIPATADINQRSLSATITAASVSGTDGSVTVNFTIADSSGGPVDDSTVVAGTNTAPYVIPVTTGTSPATLPFKSLNFTLAKLMPSLNGASTYWKSYTGKCNVNNATPNPDMVALETTPGDVTTIPASAYHNILQGYSEIEYGQLGAGKPTMAPGILTDLGGGNWSYKFALVNANTHNSDGSGDIRTITSAINLNTNATALGLDYTAVPTCPDPNAGYDATLTHRIGMILNKTSDGTDNVTNATYDFVPDGVTKAETRNIVTMANCATCHAGRKIHKGYATELCVTCHNQNTSDPSDADANHTVDLKFIVHKLHYKGTDQTVHGETFGTGPMIGYPGNVMKCTVCHNENATKPATSTSDGVSSTKTGKLENAAAWYTTPTAEACGTCHDDTAATTHIQSTGISGGVEMCTVCHGAGSADGLDAKTVHLKLIP